MAQMNAAPQNYPERLVKLGGHEINFHYDTIRIVFILN